MRSLRSKITLLTACVTVIAVLVVTVLSVFVIRTPENEKSDQLLLLLCETGERNLDYYFASVEKSVRKVASYTEKDLEGLEEEQLRNHMERVRIVASREVRVPFATNLDRTQKLFLLDTSHQGNFRFRRIVQR